MLVTYFVNFRLLNDHLFGKELFIRFTASAFRKLPSIYVFSYFPFGFEGRMWDLIVSVPDHCLSFYFDWFNAYFEVDFKVVQEANGDYLAAVRIAMINDAASLTADMQVKQNGKTVYDSNKLYRVTNIKNLLTMSQDYANSSATSEYFYLDTDDTTIKDVGNANYNKGFAIRSALVLAGKIQNSIIPLNKFSFLRD